MKSKQAQAFLDAKCPKRICPSAGTVWYDAMSRYDAERAIALAEAEVEQTVTRALTPGIGVLGLKEMSAAMQAAKATAPAGADQRVLAAYRAGIDRCIRIVEETIEQTFIHKDNDSNPYAPHVHA